LAKQTVENFSLDQMLGFVINHAAHLMRDELLTMFNTNGLNITVQEFRILGRLWEEDGLKQTEVGARTIKDKTTLTRQLDGLVKKGLAERKADALDRRVFRIHLTKQGRTFRKKVMPVVFAMLDKGQQKISQKDLTTTLKVLTQICFNLTPKG